MRNDNDADAFIRLGNMLTEERNAAHALWTWLPSYKVAEKHHGDYASEFCPSPHDVMTEAAVYFGSLKYPKQAPTSSEREWFKRCPCGEEHETGAVE